LLDRELKVYQKKISKNKQDSIWYDGVIAEIGGYTLEVHGEIKVKYKDQVLWGDDVIRFAMRKRWNDKHLKYFDFDDNNWFELFDKNKVNSYVCDGDYDSALDDLVHLFFDKEVRGEEIETK
jgi:hypothetical protein